MKRNHIFIASALLLSGFGLTSCLDYDTPTDDFRSDDIKLEDIVYHGKADSIAYTHLTSEAGFDAAVTALTDQFKITKTGQYYLRGGKNGQPPVAHAYQQQYTNSVDGYAQYFVVPHTKFGYGGTMLSTYDETYNGGANAQFIGAKNSFVPILNHPQIDSIPEMKAAYLLLYNLAAQEVADLYGPLPYVDFKGNKTEAPFKYNDLRSIYVNIEANIDTIVKAFDHFETRPQWYKDKVQNLLNEHTVVTSDVELGRTGFDTWKRFANSLKLRMAIHMAKVDPELAKKWGEEAVASGVVETTDQEIALRPLILGGFTHPTVTVTEWGDMRMSAAFESLIMSLKHPYSEYLFLKNDDAIENKTTGEITPPNSRIVGIRAGEHTGESQSAEGNPYISFSKMENQASSMAPLYIFKLSEVNLLRAEGALRGWNVGDAEALYTEAVKFGYLEDRLIGTEHPDLWEAYANVTEPVDYVYKDPTGNSPDMPSLTKIGVKWDNSLDREKKLEMIITQKYLALFPHSYEAFVDLRRTGYPKLFPVLNPDEGDGSLTEGQMIRRMLFPNDGDQAIKDIQETGLPALGGPDKQATRLWWDLDQPNNF